MKRAFDMKEKDDLTDDLIDYQIAKKINDKTIFPPDSSEMFYFVREGFQETNIS